MLYAAINLGPIDAVFFIWFVDFTGVFERPSLDRSIRAVQLKCGLRYYALFARC
jgi:hypothetical protein